MSVLGCNWQSNTTVDMPVNLCYVQSWLPKVVFIISTFDCFRMTFIFSLQLSAKKEPRLSKPAPAQSRHVLYNLAQTQPKQVPKTTAIEAKLVMKLLKKTTLRKWKLKRVHRNKSVNCNFGRSYNKVKEF